MHWSWHHRETTVMKAETLRANTLTEHVLFDKVRKIMGCLVIRRPQSSHNFVIETHEKFPLHKVPNGVLLFFCIDLPALFTSK